MLSNIRLQLSQYRKTAVSLTTLCFLFLTLMSVGFAASRHARVSSATSLGKSYVYKTVDGKQLHLYVLEPKGSSLKLKPTIIFFHGGGWVHGSAWAFETQAHHLADRGMVAVDVQYRLLTPRSRQSPKICVEDAKSAVRWVREHHNELGVNPNMIVESGGSAGGYLAAFATMVPGWNDPHDDLSVSPKADLLALYNPVIDNSPRGFGYKRFGKSYKRYSPYFYTSRSTPPTLIMSGMDDTLIHPDVLKAFKSKLEASGVPCKLVLYPGAKHGFFNHQPFKNETTAVLTSFLEKYGYVHDSR